MFILIISKGFYGSKISAFATTEFIEKLKEVGPAVGGFRCNDMSLPWGGEFNLPNWTPHVTHRNGKIADVSYFGNNPDLYNNKPNNTTPSPKQLDFEAYVNFSVASWRVAQQNSEDEGGFWTAKNELFDYCMNGGSPFPPCFQEMVVTSLSYENILEICQRYPLVTGLPHPACTKGGANFLSAIKAVSKWVETNTPEIGKLIRVPFKVHMSDGRYPTIVSGIGPSNGANWHQRALADGNWPDGQYIRKVDSNNHLTNEKILGCFNEPSCGIIGFGSDSGHINHIHVEKL